MRLHTSIIFLLLIGFQSVAEADGCQIWSEPNFKTPIASFSGYDKVALFTLGLYPHSISVASGCEAIIYEKYNFRGEKRLLSGPAKSGNWPFSSMKCYCNASIFGYSAAKASGAKPSPPTFDPLCFEDCQWAAIPKMHGCSVWTGPVPAYNVNNYSDPDNPLTLYVEENATINLGDFQAGRVNFGNNVESLTVNHKCVAKLYDKRDMKGNLIGEFSGDRAHFLNKWQKNRAISMKCDCNDSYSTVCREDEVWFDGRCSKVFCKNSKEDIEMAQNQFVDVPIEYGKIRYSCENSKIKSTVSCFPSFIASQSRKSCTCRSGYKPYANRCRELACEGGIAVWEYKEDEKIPNGRIKYQCQSDGTFKATVICNRGYFRNGNRCESEED